MTSITGINVKLGWVPIHRGLVSVTGWIDDRWILSGAKTQAMRGISRQKETYIKAYI